MPDHTLAKDPKSPDSLPFRQVKDEYNKVGSMIKGERDRHPDELRRHYEVIELWEGGMSQVDIAKVLGISQPSVSMIVKSPVFQDEMERRKIRKEEMTDEVAALALDEARIRLEKAGLSAVDKMTQLVESQDENMQFKASKDILDRVMGRSMETVGNVTNNVMVLEGEALKNLTSALKESKEREQVEATVA